MESLSLPEEAGHYLLLQRTEYQAGVAKDIFRKLRLRNIYDQYLLPHLDRNTTEELSQKYYDDLRSGFDSIRPHLPEQVDNVLDIGCGLAGIDLFIDDYYSRTPHFHLLNKDELSDIYYFFEQDGAAYNSFTVTESFLHQNGLQRDRLRTHDVTN